MYRQVRQAVAIRQSVTRHQQAADSSPQPLPAQVFALPSKLGLCLAARLVCNLNLSLHRHKSPKLVS